MKNTLKALMIIAGLAQGTAVFAEIHPITIASGGTNDYTIEPGTAECKGTELKKGKAGMIECHIDMSKNVGGIALFTIRKGDEACAVLVEKTDPLKLNGSSKTACFHTSFFGNKVNLQ